MSHTHFEHSVAHLKEIIELQSQLVSADFDLDGFMQTVVDKVQEMTVATGAIVELLEGDEMVYRAGSGTASTFVNLRLKSASSLSGLCVQTGQILYSEETATDPRVDVEACKRIGAGSMVVVPLIRRGRAVGVLKIFSPKAYAFGINDIQTLQLMAMLIGGALGQQIEMEGERRQGQHYKQLAHYDSLTGLPNRQLFYDRLSHALTRSARSKEPLALLYMDIDHFKTINDTRGHAMGDAILIAFTERVKNCVRASDTFARIGGDEFVLIGENVKTGKDATLLAQKILNVMRPEVDIDGQTFELSTSIGGVIGKNIQDMATLVRTADEALYKAKKNGRGRFEILEITG